MEALRDNQLMITIMMCSATSNGRRALNDRVAKEHGLVKQAYLAYPAKNTIAVLLLLLFSAVVLTGIAASRGAEYDEGYTEFVAAGVPRPDWPSGVFRADAVRGAFQGSSSMARIADDLRRTDVHPPLYFWSVAGWRALVGTNLFELRLFSVLLGVAGLLAVAAIARLGAVPVVPAMLLTLGCYGYSYTSVVARGFALAQALTLAGVLVLLLAEQRRAVLAALGGGVLLGLATFTNYLAAFVAAAALLWMLLRLWRRPAPFLAAAVGFAAVLPADLWFFLAQRGSRVGQFPPFRLLASLERLAQYAAGDVFGGLPLYVSGVARTALGGALALLLAGLVVVIAWRWRRIGVPGSRLLFALAAVAPPVGLIVLGLVFDNTPIELRYLAFAAPFLALLLAGALAGLRPLLALVLAVQAAALVGLALMPQTMQPQAATTRAAAALAGTDGLVLIPRGNDGVGIVGAVVQSSPDWLHLLIVPRAATAQAIRAETEGAPVVVLALLGLDGDSRATLPVMLAAFQDQSCWRQTAHDGDTVAFTRLAACDPGAER